MWQWCTDATKWLVYRASWFINQRKKNCQTWGWEVYLQYITLVGLLFPNWPYFIWRVYWHLEWSSRKNKWVIPCPIGQIHGLYWLNWWQNFVLLSCPWSRSGLWVGASLWYKWCIKVWGVDWIPEWWTSRILRHFYKIRFSCTGLHIHCFFFLAVIFKVNRSE